VLVPVMPNFVMCSQVMCFQCLSWANFNVLWMFFTSDIMCCGCMVLAKFMLEDPSFMASCY
jgi:hypothetical protein